MSERSYEGPPVDGTVQYLGDAPHWQGDGETVAVVDDETSGETTVEDVPSPETDRPDDVDGQSTLDDWGWSA